MIYVKLLNTFELEIKKSKFIAYYYIIETKDEAKEILEKLRKEHKKARHIPYAYILNNTAAKSDDKEPSGTSGMPIYQTLEQNNLKNRAIFVVRYYGGIKLGAGGLTRAYRKAASEDLNLNNH